MICRIMMSMFADRKMALGFAGAVMILAVLSSLGIGAKPSSQEPAPRAIAAAPPASAPRPRPSQVSAQPTQTWADDGESGDWSAAETEAGGAGSQFGTDNSSTTSQGARTSTDDADAVTFGDYAPSRRTPAPAQARAPVSRQFTSGRNGLGSRRGGIQSSAAPGAPIPQPPVAPPN